jgi:hypothetical protein
MVAVADGSTATVSPTAGNRVRSPERAVRTVAAMNRRTRRARPRQKPTSTARTVRDRRIATAGRITIGLEPRPR